MRVLVVGASCRAVAQSAARAGHAVCALDAFGDADLLEVAAWHPRHKGEPLAAIPLCRDADVAVFASGVENRPEVVEELRAMGVRPLAPSPQTLRACRDVETLMRVCAENDIPFPCTRRDAPSPTDGPYLVKKKRGGAGIGVRDWDGSATADADAYYQEKIGGTPFSAAFLADGTRAVVAGISRQFAGEAFLGAGGYAWCGNLMPYPVPLGKRDAFAAEIRRIADALTGAFGLLGANSADFVQRNDTIYLLEINPRISASFELVETMSGQNAFTLHADACDGRLPAEGKGLLDPPYRAKGIVYAPRELTAPDTRGWAARGRRDIPLPDAPLPEGAPLCTVITPPFGTESEAIAYLAAEAHKIWGECGM